MEQHDLLSNDLLISDISQSNLNTTAKWGKFLAVIGFISCVLMVVGGLVFIAVMSSSSSRYSYTYNNEIGRYMGIAYIILAIILFFPSLYLLKFSNKMQEAIRSTSQESLDASFTNLKSLFKFYGVFTIIILVIYALAFLGGIATMMR